MNALNALTLLTLLAGPSDPATYAHETVYRTNLERVKLGLAPLKASVRETAAAQWMAEDQARHNVCRHTDSLGRDFSTRAREFGVGRAMGENCAAGQRTPESVTKSWMASPGHRKNMLNPGAKLIGLGYATGSKGYGAYWTMVLGDTDTLPLIIDNEALGTDRDDVSLYLYGKGLAQKMRISNGDGQWTEWRPFQQTLNWTLAPGKGPKKVRVELAGANGDTCWAEDTIERR